MNQTHTIDVECHAGHSYPQRPRAFTWLGEKLPVDELLEEWRTPAAKTFKVRSGQQLFLLNYIEENDSWQVEII